MRKEDRMNFDKLTPEKIIEGINLTLKNAESLFGSASRLKNLGNYGLSNSLYILSCEEAIKAFALYNYFIVDDGRDITPIFKSHKEKLEILKQGYHLLSSEALAMHKSFKQAFGELIGKEDKEIEARAQELYPEIFNEIYSDYKTKDVDDKWWDKANINKQRGFYVGLEKLNWQSPTDISLEELNETAKKHG